MVNVIMLMKKRLSRPHGTTPVPTSDPDDDVIRQVHRMSADVDSRYAWRSTPSSSTDAHSEVPEAVHDAHQLHLRDSDRSLVVRKSHLALERVPSRTSRSSGHEPEAEAYEL